MARRHTTASKSHPLITVLSVLAIGLALAACTSGPSGRPGPNGLWLEKPQLLQAANPALVAQYNVNYIVAEQASALTQNKPQNKAQNNGPVTPALLVHLEGVNGDVLKAITEAAYTDFNDKLTARGFAISNRSIDERLSPFAISQLSKNTVKGFGKNVAQFRQFSENRIDTVTVGPEELPVIRPDQHLAIAIAAGENGTRPMTVDYTLRFARLESGSPANSTVADTGVSFTPSLELIAGSHLALYHNPKNVAKITLREPISARRQNQNRELQTADGFDGVKVYRYRVDAQRFQRDALELLKQANSRLVNAL